MKSCLIFLVCILSAAVVATGQPCKQITISDTSQRRVIQNYITDSVKRNFFVQDKGVVVITRYVNETGRPSWLIRTMIDDGYKDNPPVEWANVGEDIVLFYDARSRYDVVKHEATPALLGCLDEAIGDRVYVRPAKRERLVEIRGANGNVHKRDVRRLFGGNTTNEQVVIFEQDGTVQILSTV